LTPKEGKEIPKSKAYREKGSLRRWGFPGKNSIDFASGEVSPRVVRRGGKKFQQGTRNPLLSRRPSTPSQSPIGGEIFVGTTYWLRKERVYNMPGPKN